MMWLLGQDPQEAIPALCELGMPRLAAKQLMQWVYRGVLSADGMTDISKAVRATFETLGIGLNPFKQVRSYSAKGDLATKFELTLDDGAKIESVVLHESDYHTLCVSSQSGCPVDCRFCLTGVVGFKRQLRVDEILGQLSVAIQAGFPITNVVFMGMGEPLLNADAVLAAIDAMNAPWGFGLSKRNVTVSTSGYVAGIRRLIDEKRAVNLAFSVGSPDPTIRRTIMPIEDRNPIMTVARTSKEYGALHNRKLTLEYTLLDGVNHSDQECRELAHLAQYLDAKVNLINLNPHPKIPFRPVSEATLQRFKTGLAKQKVPVTIRFKRGQDIAAACGQLGESCLSTRPS